MSDAVSALKEALAFSPDNVPLRAHLARTLLEAGRPREALAEARDALRRAPDHAAALRVAGAAARELGDESELYANWWPIRASLEAEELLSLARSALRLGHRDAARAAYDAALGKDPSVRDLELDRGTRLAVVGAVAAPVAEPAAPDARGLAGATRGAAAEAAPRERPVITFADVGGLDVLKERLRMDIVYPLQKPELFRAYGKKIGGGVLLYGPPGCGKTHLARAAAGECNASFIAVEIQQVLDMWLGESEKHLHALFERARDEAPSILFFDEIEAIGASRHQLKHGPGRRMVNQLLTELDGVGASNHAVLVLGATNAPWDVDPALRRPGRFDRVVFVPPPDLAGRESILRLAFRDRPAEGLDYASMARRTARFSGADLQHLAEVASERALTEALRTGNVRPVTAQDVFAVLDRVRPTTTEWLDAARRYVTYANQAGLYDDVAAYLRDEGASA